MGKRVKKKNTTLFFDSFKVQHLQEAKTFNEQWNLNLKKGDWTWCQWPTALFTTQYDFSLKYFWTPLGQSILMAIVACLIAVIVGGVLAWFITRSNIPFKKYISTVFIFPFQFLLLLSETCMFLGGIAF